MCRGIIKVDLFFPFNNSDDKTESWFEDEMLKKFGGFTVDGESRRGEWRDSSKHIDQIRKYEILIPSENFNPSYFRGLKNELENQLNEKEVLIKYQSAQQI
jgi:hypothetical protein